MPRPRWRQTEDRAFVDAVIAAPESDPPRLVFADALQQRGDERGELIVVQCALAEATPDDPRRPSLEARNAEILATIGPAFPHVQALLHRGFALKSILTEGGELELPAEPLLATTRELALWRFRAGRFASLVRELALDDVPLLRSIAFSNRINALAGAEVLAGWSIVSAVPALTFLGNDLGLAGLEAILRQRSRPLAELVVHGDAVTGIGAALERHRATELTRLEAAASAVEVSDIEMLVRSQLRLEHLVLDLNLLGDEGVLALASGTAPLRRLGLANIGLTGAGAAAFAERASFPLEELSIASADWTDPSALGHLAARFDRLRVLRVGSFSLGPEAAAALLRNVPPSLRVLELDSSNLGPEGAEALARSHRFTTLSELGLAHTMIEASGIAALASSGILDHLTRLDLTNCALADSGARVLVASALPRQTKVDLSMNQISETVAAELRERFPNLTL